MRKDLEEIFSHTGHCQSICEVQELQVTVCPSTCLLMRKLRTESSVAVIWVILSWRLVCAGINGIFTLAKRYHCSLYIQLWQSDWLLMLALRNEILSVCLPLIVSQMPPNCLPTVSQLSPKCLPNWGRCSSTLPYFWHVRLHEQDTIIWL